jgi:hypothetical protein
VVAKAVRVVVKNTQIIAKLKRKDMNNPGERDKSNKKKDGKSKQTIFEGGNMTCTKCFSSKVSCSVCGKSICEQHRRTKTKIEGKHKKVKVFCLSCFEYATIR